MQRCSKGFITVSKHGKKFHENMLKFYIFFSYLLNRNETEIFKNMLWYNSLNQKLLGRITQRIGDTQTSRVWR